MNRFRFKNSKLNTIFIIIIFITISYIYISTFINSNIGEVIKKDINSKYSFNKINLKDTLLYTSLNKIVSFDDLNKNNEINEYELLKTIDKLEVKKSQKNTSNKKIVYIYNTHDTEKYSLPFISDYSITPTVKIASYILKDHLNDLGVNSFVQTRSINSYLNKHNLDYKGAYEASRVYMKEEMKKNKYKILLDIHRDSVSHKYTLFNYKNKKYARIMFVLTTKHKNYKKNLKFVNKINNKLNKKYNGISRGIMKRNDVIFNQDLSPYAILIELGGVDNTLEEINNTLKVLAEILNEFIKEEKL